MKWEKVKLGLFDQFWVNYSLLSLKYSHASNHLSFSLFYSTKLLSVSLSWGEPNIICFHKSYILNRAAICSVFHSLYSLVRVVPNWLGNFQAAIVVSKGSLVEGLGLIELESVQGSPLVSVSVLLSSPESTVPVLTVSTVAGSKLITLELSNLENLGVLELDWGVARSPVVLVLSSRREVASSEGSSAVILWVAVGSRFYHSFSSETSRGSVELSISGGDLGGVETSWGKVILRSIKTLVEHFTGLLGNSATDVGVNSNTWLIASVARDNCRFLTCRDLLIITD